MASNINDGINSLNNEYVLKIEDFNNDIENLYDLEAARKMSQLNQWIQSINKDRENRINDLDYNIFLTRLLFCFFADDIGIFSKSLFSDSLKKYTEEDGNNLSDYLSRAFIAMDTYSRSMTDTDVAQFPYVNGGLFSDKIKIPYLDQRARELILECCNLDWTLINPDIFGSIIQSVITSEERYTLGIHYTSIPNIMKLIRLITLGPFSSVGAVVLTGDDL